MNWIQVILVVCKSLADVASCQHVPVVSNEQDYVSIGGCLSLQGMESAKQFWEQHPLYHSWQFKGWECQMGNKKPVEESKG